LVVSEVRMFEGLVADLIQRVCGDFVEDLDSKNLNVSVWNGTVKLENLVLRSSAFDSLGLPITLVHGTIDLVEFHVPWKSLRTSHVVVNIKNLNAILGPNVSHQDVDRKLQEQRDARRSRLDKDLKSRQIALTSNPGEEASWIAKLITTIVNNIEVKIEGLSIRYEDAVSNPSHALACGFNMKGLFLETADENFIPIPFFPDMGRMYKVARLDSFVLHWQSDVQCATESCCWKERLECTNEQNFVVHPLALIVKLTLTSKSAAPNPGPAGSGTSELVAQREPRISAVAETECVRLSLRPAVLRDAAILADALAAHRARSRRLARRPVVACYRGHYGTWWRYAIQEAAREARARRFRLESMVTSARNAKEYVPLFRRQLAVLPLPLLSEAETARLLQIEDDSPDEFVHALRGRVQQAVEAQARELVEQAKGAQTVSRGVMQRLCSGLGWAWTGVEGAQEVLLGGVRVTLTPAQAHAIEGLFSEACGDEQEARAENSDVLHRLQVRVGEVAINLQQPAGPEQPNKLIACLELVQAHACVSLRERGYCASASLLGASIRSCAAGERPDILYINNRGLEGTSAAAAEDSTVPFVTTFVEYLPLDGHCDYMVRAAVLPVVGVLRPEWVRAVSSWCGAAANVGSRYSEESPRGAAALAETLQKGRSKASSAVAGMWLTRMVIDLLCTIESSTLRFISVVNAEVSDSGLSGRQAMSQNIQSLVEIRLGRCIAKTQLTGACDSDQDGQYDQFFVGVSGFEVLACDGKDTRDYLSEEKNSRNFCAGSFDAEMWRIIGPLSLSAEVDLAITRTLPTVTLLKIRCKMKCPTARVHDDLLWNLEEVIRAFCSSWASESRLHTSNCQIPKYTCQTCAFNPNSELNEFGQNLQTPRHTLNQQKTALFNMFRSATPRKASLTVAGCDQKLVYARWKLVDFDFQLVDTFAIELTERNDHKTLLLLSAEDFKVSIVLRHFSLDFELRLLSVDIKDNILHNHAKGSQSVSDLGYLVKTRRVIIKPATVCQDFFSIKAAIIDKRSPEYQRSDTDLKLEVIIGFVEISLYQQSLFAFRKWLEKIPKLKSSPEQALALKRTKITQNHPGFFPLWLQNSFLENHNFRSHASCSNLMIRLFQNIEGKPFEIAHVEVIAACCSLSAAESIYANVTVENFKLVDPNQIHPTTSDLGCQNIFSPLKEESRSDCNLLEITFTLMPSRHENRVSIEIKGFQINICLLFAENLVRYFQDLNTLWAPKQIYVAAEEIESSNPDFLSIECKFRRCEIFIPINQAQRPTSAGILMKISDAHLQNHELQLCCTLQYSFNLVGVDSSVSEIFKTNAIVYYRDNISMLRITCEQQQCTSKIKLKSSLLRVKAQDLIMLTETCCNIVDRACILARNFTEEKMRGVSELLHNSEMTVKKAPAMQSKCIDVEIDVFEARFLGQCAFTAAPDELCITARSLNGTAQWFPDGTSEVRLTLGRLSVDFLTIKSHSFKNILDSGFAERHERMLRAYALHLFHLCDQDRSGTLQVDELVDIMCKVGHPVSMEQAQNIMSKADLDDSGVLDSEEFLQLFGPKEIKHDAEAEAAMKSLCTCCMKQLAGGSQQLEIEIGRLDFVLTKEPFDILALYVDSLELCVKKFTDTNADKNTKKTHDQGIFKTFFRPIKELRNELVDLSKLLPRSKVSHSMNLHLEGVECGIILDSSTFASNCMFFKSGPIQYETVSNKDSIAGNFKFFLKDFELAISLPHSHPKTRWESILQPSNLEIIQAPSGDNNQHLEGEIRIDSLTLNMKISYMIFITRLIQLFTQSVDLKYPLQRARDPSVQTKSSWSCSSHQACQRQQVDDSFSTDMVMKTTWTMDQMDLCFKLIDDLEIHSHAVTIITLCVTKLRKTLSVCDANATFVCNLCMGCDVINREHNEWEPLLEPWSLKFEALAQLDSRTQLVTIAADSEIKLAFAPDHIQTLSSFTRKYTEAVTRSTSAPAAVASEGKIKFDIFSNSLSHSTFNLANCTQYTLLVEVFFDEKSGLKDSLPEGARIQIPVPYKTAVAMRMRPEISHLSEWSELMPILTRNDHMSENIVPNGLPVRDQENPVSRTLVSCFARPHVLHFEVLFQTNSASIHIPWKVTNLLPHTMRLTLWAKASQHTSHVRESTALSLQSASTENLPFSLKMVNSIFLEIDHCGFHMSQEVDLRGQCDPSVDSERYDLELADCSGRTVKIHAILTCPADKDSTLVFYPQMILVNWTGLPLKWGRCRINLEHKKMPGCRRFFQGNNDQNCRSNVKEIIEAAGVETQLTSEMFPSQDFSLLFAQENQAFDRTSSCGEPTAWNKKLPSVLLFHCPAGPEWDPCVSICGTNKWERISDDFENNDGGLHDGSILQRLSVISLASSRLNGTHNCAEYELGIDIGHGISPFHRTIYLHIMPRLTVVNDSGITLEVCQEEYIGMAEVAALRLHDRTLMTSLDTFLPSQNPNIVIRQVSNSSQPLTIWSGPFDPSKVQEAAFLLWPVGEGDGEEQSIQLRCEINMWSASIFIHLLPHDVMTALYSVRNDGLVDVKLWQKHSSFQEQRAFTIRSGQHRAIAWHETGHEDSAIVCIMDASDVDCVFVVNMDDIGRKGKFGKHGQLEYEVQMDCSTHVLCIQCPTELSKPYGVNVNDSTQQKLLLYMEGISVSLVNTKRMELLHGFMGALTCNCIVENETVNVTLKIQRLQMSNQTELGHPVVIASPCDQNGFMSSQQHFLKVMVQYFNRSRS